MTPRVEARRLEAEARGRRSGQRGDGLESDVPKWTDDVADDGATMTSHEQLPSQRANLAALSCSSAGACSANDKLSCLSNTFQCVLANLTILTVALHLRSRTELVSPLSWRRPFECGPVGDKAYGEDSGCRR